MRLVYYNSLPLRVNLQRSIEMDLRLLNNKRVRECYGFSFYSMYLRIRLFKNFIRVPDFAQLFAIQIARTARDIDAVIESLPNDEQSLELQVTFHYPVYEREF